MNERDASHAKKVLNGHRLNGLRLKIGKLASLMLEWKKYPRRKTYRRSISSRRSRSYDSISPPPRRHYRYRSRSRSYEKRGRYYRDGRDRGRSPDSYGRKRRDRSYDSRSDSPPQRYQRKRRDESRTLSKERRNDRKVYSPRSPLSQSPPPMPPRSPVQITKVNETK